ncbi:MAG: glycosyltransferase family 2 protein [Candidatus Aminicenantes bacterium]|nr:MAG: glycosyltransferase family 2 protein [Candidatus Aminicenantes bacterium]
MCANQVSVSIIVPAYNAEDHLARSLPAIKKSDYPYYELIVVDDHSTDGTAETARKYADILISMRIKGAPGKARNKGADKGRGSILFYLDADVEISPDSISRIVKFLEENPDIGAVFGSYDDNPHCKDFFSQYKNLFHHFVHQNAKTEASTFWAGCGAIRKKVFLEAGGFPERYSSPAIEDVEMGYKLKEQAIEIRLVKELQVKHLKKWNFLNLLKTDIFQRAVPWARLSLEKGLPYDLNFKLSDRISGILACLTPISLIVIWWYVPCVFISIMFAGALFYMNRKLYRFYLLKKGWKFAILSVFLHWFYLFYSSITLISATGIFMVKKILSKWREAFIP